MLTTWNSNEVKISIDNLLLKRIESFWASALHRDVFPVPGGPWSRMILQSNHKHKKLDHYTVDKTSIVTDALLPVCKSLSGKFC